MEIKPVPQERFKEFEFGLIVPTGEFYHCNYAGHSNLAWELLRQGTLKEGTLNHYGSVHVSEGFDDIYEGYTVTQAQLDTMFDYAVQHGIKFDASILRVK